MKVFLIQTYFRGGLVSLPCHQVGQELGHIEHLKSTKNVM